MFPALTRPLRERQTYRNLAYLALPLGVLAFLRLGLTLGLAIARPAYAPPDAGIAGRLKTTLCCPTTWQRLGYLAARLPLAAVTVAVAAVALALSAALLSAPLTFAEDEAPFALAGVAAGLAALPLSLPLVNALAGVRARLGRALLPAAA